MLKALVYFGLGFAAGVYVDQNYVVPHLKPQELLDKIKTFFEEKKKDKDR